MEFNGEDMAKAAKAYAELTDLFTWRLADINTPKDKTFFIPSNNSGWD